jgi:hypothetical protein
MMFIHMVEVSLRTAIDQWGIAVEPDSKPFARSVAPKPEALGTLRASVCLLRVLCPSWAHVRQ